MRLPNQSTVYARSDWKDYSSNSGLTAIGQSYGKKSNHLAAYSIVGSGHAIIWRFIKCIRCIQIVRPSPYSRFSVSVIPHQTNHHPRQFGLRTSSSTHPGSLPQPKQLQQPVTTTSHNKLSHQTVTGTLQSQGLYHPSITSQHTLETTVQSHHTIMGIDQSRYANIKTMQTLNIIIVYCHKGFTIAVSVITT